ncbi:MAG: hypothetical protein ACRD1M_05745 [Terriglobales bacterium]
MHALLEHTRARLQVLQRRYDALPDLQARDLMACRFADGFARYRNWDPALSAFAALSGLTNNPGPAVVMAKKSLLEPLLLAALVHPPYD